MTRKTSLFRNLSLASALSVCSAGLSQAQSMGETLNLTFTDTGAGLRVDASGYLSFDGARTAFPSPGEHRFLTRDPGSQTVYSLNSTHSAGSWDVSGVTLFSGMGPLNFTGTNASGDSFGLAVIKSGSELLLAGPARHIYASSEGPSSISTMGSAQSVNGSVTFAGATVANTGVTAQQIMLHGFGDFNPAPPLEGGPQNNALAGYYQYLNIIINAAVIDLESLATTSRPGTILPLVSKVTIHGAHHRLLMDSALDKDGWHTWASGDFSRYDELDATQAVGEIGASRNFGIENFRLGLGVGHSATDQDTTFGGGSSLKGDFLVLEANYQLKGTNVFLSALGYYGEYDVETSRGYSGGGAHSFGNTDASNYAIRLRADWKNAYVNGKMSVTPRVSYTFSDTSVDAFTEVGGGTPASYAKQENEEHEFRLGVDIDYALCEKASLRGIVEFVHLEGDDVGISGTSGGVGFSLPGQDLKNSWGRAGLELVAEMNPSTNLHLGAFASTEGQDASFTGTVGFPVKF